MQIKALKNQVGSIFANVALGAAAMGSVAAVTADWTAQQAALALQKQQGQVFAALNDAVGNYMTVLYPQLTEQSTLGVDNLPASCAKLPYRAGESLPTEADIMANKCNLTVTLSTGSKYTVKNAFQPTLADLKALGILDRGISDVPVMPTELLVAGPDSNGIKSTAPAANGYAISIQPKCVGTGSGSNSCNKTNKALFSSVINIQPFAQSQYTQNFLTLLWAAGPDAAMSGPADAINVTEQSKRVNPNGEFRAIQSGWTRDNPITREWSVTAGGTTTTYTRGVDNLMLMRNGYDSAYWQMSRRDGSTPPTANWDFNGKDLTNVGKFTAASAEIKDLKVTGDQTIDGDQTVKGNQTVNGNLDVDGAGTFKGLLSALGNLVVEGTTELKKTLTVAGKAFFKDDVTLDKNLSVAGTTTLSGALTGTSATFSGALSGTSATFSGLLTANSLKIGGTEILKDGTLLGGATGWGVKPNDACSKEYALAQSTDGKLQICRSGAWTALFTNETTLPPVTGVGDACSPEGAPGRLPDGTLVVWKGGKWVSATQGDVTLGGVCYVSGAVATVQVSGNQVLVGCKDGKWSHSIFRPQVTAESENASCSPEGALAVNNAGYSSMLQCRGGTWQRMGTQLLTGMLLGGACTQESVLAGDIDKTGLLVCRNGVWSKITDPIGVGGSCSPNGKQVTLPDGSVLSCVNGVWTAIAAGAACTPNGKQFTLPNGTVMTCVNGIWTVPALGAACMPNGSTYTLPSGTLAPGEVLYCRSGTWRAALFLTRPDGVKVRLMSPIEHNGDRYYLHKEVTENDDYITRTDWIGYVRTTLKGRHFNWDELNDSRRCSDGGDWPYWTETANPGNTYTACVPTVHQLVSLIQTKNPRSGPWQGAIRENDYLLSVSISSPPGGASTHWVVNSYDGGLWDSWDGNNRHGLVYQIRKN